MATGVVNASSFIDK